MNCEEMYENYIKEKCNKCVNRFKNDCGYGAVIAIDRSSCKCVDFKEEEK